jgi:hypothetical protein
VSPALRRQRACAIGTDHVPAIHFRHELTTFVIDRDALSGAFLMTTRSCAARPLLNVSVPPPEEFLGRLDLGRGFGTFGFTVTE